VTAVPGRTVAVARVGPGCFVVCRVAGTVPDAAAVVGRAAVAGGVAEAGEVAVVRCVAGTAVRVVDPVDSVDGRESALAGMHAATVPTTSKALARAGQWRSGRRIMRWDKHFHSVATTLWGRRPALRPNARTLPERTSTGSPEALAHLPSPGAHVSGDRAVSGRKIDHGQFRPPSARSGPPRRYRPG
jgi:hypothetical protein